LRCLAVVRLHRAKANTHEDSGSTTDLLSLADRIKQNDAALVEIEEAGRLCQEADELVSPTESRVSQLWLGPLHIEVLLAQGKSAEAVEKIAPYRKLVSQCQSPRFTREAERLTDLLGKVELQPK